MKGKDTCSCRSASATTCVHKVPAGVDVKVAGAKQELDHRVRHRQAEGRPASPPSMRASRPPEPYQGKGVRYQGEYIFRKEGKKK